MLASGILGTTKTLLKRVAESGAGAVTIKSVSKDSREGHHNPTVITYEAGMLNAVGYSNPGVEAARIEYSNLNEIGVPVIASIIGTCTDDFIEVAVGAVSIRVFRYRNTAFLSSYSWFWPSVRTGNSKGYLRNNLCGETKNKMCLYL